MAALDDLSALTGLSIIVDPRAKPKAQTALTAPFNGDVALRDAVLMLAEMAELKPVFLTTGAARVAEGRFCLAMTGCLADLRVGV